MSGGDEQHQGAEPEPPAADGPTGGRSGGPIDVSRVRSFVGLSIGLVGPRANLAVSGVLITLFVQQRATGALAVTFALTADRLVSWVTYPVAGRLSDRTRSRVGRRTPYMAGSLIVMGVATWMFTVVSGYWLLVLMILIAGQASATFTLTNVAVVPEVFGRSRWIKALLLTTVLGTVASLAIKGTVIASWKQSDPATWNLPFQVAGAIMVGVGVAVLLLVREAPVATYGAEVDRKVRARPTRDELRDILAGPNAKVLIGGSLLFWSGVGSTAYVVILFFQRVLHAGASAQTVAGLVTGLPVFFIGIALGIPLSRKLTPMQLAIGAPLVGAVLAGVQYFDTHLWQAVLLGYIGAPFIGAYIIVMAPLLLQLLPRGGGLGERLGVLLAPFNLCSVVLAYVAAMVIDATGNYRLIWLFPAATGLAHATVNCWLKYPTRRTSDPDMVKRLWEWSIVQAESMAETGIVTGLLAAPLLGVVTKEDADSAVVIDMARNILGNPYEDGPDHETADPSSPTGTAQGQTSEPEGTEPEGTEPQSASGDHSPSAGGGTDGVTGVRQVGGGPFDGLAIGDQKSGRGPSSTSDGSETAPSDDASAGGGSTGVSEKKRSEDNWGGRSPNGPSRPIDRTGTTPEGGVTSSPDSTGDTGHGGLDGRPDRSDPAGGEETGAGGADGVRGAGDGPATTGGVGDGAPPGAVRGGSGGGAETAGAGAGAGVDVGAGAAATAGADGGEGGAATRVRAGAGTASAGDRPGGENTGGEETGAADGGPEPTGVGLEGEGVGAAGAAGHGAAAGGPGGAGPGEDGASEAGSDQGGAAGAEPSEPSEPPDAGAPSR